jgi:hypothetical protein
MNRRLHVFGMWPFRYCQDTVLHALTGTVMHVCPTYEDWFGYTERDVNGAGFMSLVAAGTPSVHE